MIDLGRWGLRNSKLIYFLVAVSVVGGLLSVGGMSKLEDPEIAMKCALVVTSYPGASAHEVELEVTDVLEKSISSMGDVEYVNSRSMDGISVITVILSDYVQQDRVQEMFSILRRKVGDVQSQLPSGAYESVVADDFGDVYGIFFALTADNYSHKELKEYVQLIQRELEAVTGVSKVSVYGLTPECIHIDLKAEVIASLEITPTEILQYINSYTQLVYAGSYKASGHKLRIDAGQRCTTSEELGNLLLTGRSGEQFRLKDIAYVYEGYDESAYEELMYDGRQAVGIAVSAESDTDITQVGKAVEARMDELFSAIIPNGIELHKVFHQPDKVNDALLMSLKNLIEALVIVIVVVMLSMGLRSGMIIATNLMVIVLGSLLILYFMGGTVQRVSLAAFILALGMLVDDVIVIMDGILLDLKRGLPKEQALTAIGRKTALPLLGATLISVLAFLPIFLSQDSTGEYVRDFFIVLAVSLMMSWLLALIYAPLQAKNMLKPSSKPETNPFEGKSYKMLRKVLHWGLRHRAVTMGGVVMLLAIAGYCWQFMPQGFFPDMSYDQLYIEYKLPEGTDSKRVKADLDEITAYLLSREEITHVTASVGATPARYNLVRPLADGSPSYGELIVDYTSPKKLVATMDEIQQELTDRYPDAYLRLKRYNLMWENYPIAVQFKGPDPAVLRALTEEAVEIMKSSPMLTLPCTDWGNQTPVMHLDYDNPTALKTGITPEYVGMSVLAVTDGIPIGNCHDGDDVKPVYLKVVDKDCETMGNIADASVFTAMGTSVPMRTITDSITVKWHDPIVLRENGQRAMRAQCNPVNGISTENARQTIASRIEAISLPEGYTMEWKGETSASSTASSPLFKYFPLSIVLIISILILLFKDYRKPLIIICCIPLMLIGVVFGMLISGKMFGFIAIVGILGLMGLIVRNGVVLMDEINLQLSEGKDTVEALLDSSATRFRPVMIAALTTIVGMVPLLGDDLFGSLAVTMMSGLLVGTLITLVVLPILYSIVFRIKIK